MAEGGVSDSLFDDLEPLDARAHAGDGDGALLELTNLGDAPLTIRHDRTGGDLLLEALDAAFPQEDLPVAAATVLRENLDALIGGMDVLDALEALPAGATDVVVVVDKIEVLAVVQQQLTIIKPSLDLAELVKRVQTMTDAIVAHVAHWPAAANTCAITDEASAARAWDDLGAAKDFDAQIETLYEPLASPFFQTHRAITGLRTVARKALTDAIPVYDRKIVTWNKDEAARRAREAEEERQRQIEENRRNAELDAEALTTEAAATGNPELAAAAEQVLERAAAAPPPFVAARPVDKPKGAAVVTRYKATVTDAAELVIAVALSLMRARNGKDPLVAALKRNDAAGALALIQAAPNVPILAVKADESWLTTNANNMKGTIKTGDYPGVAVSEDDKTRQRRGPQAR